MTVSYEEVLNAVCEELVIKKSTMVQGLQGNEMVFANGLFVKLCKDLGLKLSRAARYINKSHTMPNYYIGIADNYIKFNRAYRESYRNCCKALGVDYNPTPKKALDQNEQMESDIRNKIAKIKPDKHYTRNEEVAMIRAIEEAKIFMLEYGAGQQPLEEGYILTRKKG